MARHFANLTGAIVLVFVAAFATGLGAASAETDAASGVVKAGAGGYLTAPPKPCKPLPEKIYRTEEVKGPMVTGQWWSSLVWQKYSQNLFAHPLAMQCRSNGLVVWYPGDKIHGNASGIFGTGAGRDGDFRLGHSAADSFPEANCGGYSDWFVTASFVSGAASLRASFGHGSPFVYCLYGGGNPAITFPKKPIVWSGDAQSPVLGVTINNHHYGLFGPAGSTWKGMDNLTWINDLKGKAYFSVALLPDNRPETLALFKRYAYNHVVDTRLEFQVAGGFVKASYTFSIKFHEGAESKNTVFALYPHQWRYATVPLTEMTYGSVRGLMKAGIGSGFETQIPIQGVLPFLPAQGIQDRERMLGYLKEEAAKKTGGFGDTYWEGKLLGRLATLSGVAEAAGAPDLRNVFVSEIKRRLENWFSAAPGKEQAVFYYNGVWGALLGSRPSYGSDRPLNDHHFHYGYFIRAAAEVARLDPAWARSWGPMVRLLIRDIASPERGDSMFPYLRCFDKYAGHSWASGDANFADGNNQESSSESMNAWYGMMLWGEATGDKLVRDTGIGLFNMERTAVEEYWFDVHGQNFPKDFPNVALGMIWGGKGAFGTWFSGDIDCIHGINWLPFTPASIYMGRHPDYVRKNHDRIVERRKGGRDYNNGWGDLLIMFYALSDPAAAAAFIDSTPNCKLEGGNTHAFMYHWIYTLNNLGRNAASVTADYPFFNVYVKDGKKTYAVYNYGASPLTVNFSDGMKVTAGPNGLTVK
jgi:endoglucanase Acf2